MEPRDLIAQILGEARHYEQFSDIEKLVEVGGSLENIPLQPLYHALQGSSAELIAEVLPKLSQDQRQAMIDLDFWKKDVVNVEGFEFWLEVYTRCKDDEVLADFVRSEDFLLYLKSRVNIWTFDAEDPEYPDHDYYFLTDDGLLLVEYSDSYSYVSEIKYMIKVLYSELGMENAYTTLFKLINDNFSILQEQSFHEKKERLRDYGVLDYYEAQEQLHPFMGAVQAAKFIQKKVKATGTLSAKHINQKLPSSSLVAFENESPGIKAELAKIENEKRLNFLSFSFVRTVNATLAINDAFAASRMTLLQIGKYTRTVLELAIDFTKAQKDFGDESVLDYFDFSELYKIGSTLFEANKKEIKKALKEAAFDQDSKEYFLGPWWSNFLDHSFGDVPVCRSFGAGRHPMPINSLATYDFWKKQTTQFIQMLPFIQKFYETITSLSSDGKIADEYYLNYQVDSIDYEAILLSSLVHFDQKQTGNKLGITIDEFLKFIKKHFTKQDAEYVLMPHSESELQPLLTAYAQQYGLSAIDNFNEYLFGILYEHMSGYEYDQLGLDDFQHVGGPILLKTLGQ